MKRVIRMLALTLVFSLVTTLLVTPMEQAVAAKKANVAKVTFTKPNGSTLILKKGASYSLKTNVAVKPNTKKNRAVAYTSNKPNVVSVNKNGKVKALKTKGSAVITARSVWNKKRTARINVRIGTPVNKVNLRSKSAILYVGDAYDLSKSVTLSPKNPTMKKIAWSSNKPKVATVKNGVITAKGAGNANIYASATDGSGKRAVCKVTVYGRTTAWKTDVALKDYYKDDFLVGVAIPTGTLISDSDSSRLARYHFNSVTSENDMKPDSLLDWQACEKNAASGNDAPVIKFGTMDKMLDYAQKNGLKVRFHTLVWFSQTPAWFFHEGYDNSNPLVSAEVMKKRMESYITQIVDYVETKYPGLVYAWDVVNEAMEKAGDPTADTEHFNMRTTDSTWDNLWYKTVGWEYVKCAFQYTKNALKKYNSNAKLFYNDYMERTMRKEIIAMLNDVNATEKLVDGMGCQAHFSLSSEYSIKDYYSALLEYQAAGFEIQITEIDIMCSVNETRQDYDKQASMYRTYFDMFRNVPAITSVTVWGVDDSVSWRAAGFPLLFDEKLTPKKAFYGAIQDPSIPLIDYK